MRETVSEVIVVDAATYSLEYVHELPDHFCLLAM
jgi:hypothetical protein